MLTQNIDLRIELHPIKVKDFEEVPEYNFDVLVMFVLLACFMAFYELLMYIYSRRIKNISIKEIMLES